MVFRKPKLKIKLNLTNKKLLEHFFGNYSEIEHLIDFEISFDLFLFFTFSF
jgi:hypothetical protein